MDFDWWSHSSAPFLKFSGWACLGVVIPHRFYERKPSPKYYPANGPTLLFLCLTDRISLFYQIFGAKGGLAQGFNVIPMRPAQAIKRYHQSYIRSTYRAFRGSSFGTPWVVLRRTEFCVCALGHFRIIPHRFSWLAGCLWARW